MNYSETREELLIKTIHRKQPRAVDDNDYCQYSHEHHGGCAIGCDIPQDLAVSLNQSDSVDTHNVFPKLPSRLQNMGADFLKDVQRLHDCMPYWIDAWTAELGGKHNLVWSDKGINFINEIITKYELKLDKLYYL